MATGQEVREYMVDYFGLGRRGTNTGTATTSIADDPNFGGPAAAEGIENGCQAMITSGTGAPAEEVVQLTSRPKPSTGIMTVDPDFTAALASGDTFEVLYKPFRFEDGQYGLRAKINEAIKMFEWERFLVPITLVPDGDMLKAGVGDWTDVGSGTAAKSAATFPHGLRSLQLMAVDADDYVRTGNIAVEENKQYILEVTGRIDSTGGAGHVGTLLLYDVTNAAQITLDQYTIDRFEPEILHNAVTIPADCEQVQIWLRSEEADDIIDWSDLIFRKVESREFMVQDRPVRILRLGKLLATSSADWSRRGDTWVEVAAQPQQLGAGLWQYRVNTSLGGLSLFYEEYIEPAALADDDDTTTIPKEYVAAVAAMLLLEPLRGEKRWAYWYDKAARMAARVRQDYASLFTVAQGQRTIVLPRVN